MPRVLLEPEAEREFRAAAQWYGERTASLAEAFRDAVDTTLNSIEQSPARYPIALRDIRKARVHRFPFVVYFVVLARAVVVIAIMHGRRNPALWQTRR